MDCFCYTNNCANTIHDRQSGVKRILFTGTKSHPDKKIRKSKIQVIEKKEAISPKPKPKQKEKEKKKPAHSYVRFGSAWQCEECKTLFSRKTYAIEHMQEQNEEL